MTSRVSEVSEMIATYDQWAAQLVPTSVDDRYYVANDELAACFVHHYPKWDSYESRKELLEVLHTRHPSGIHPICTKTWKKISCSVEPFKNGRT